MIFRQLVDKESCTFTYVVGDETTGEAALVDPVVEHVERDLKLLQELGLRLTAVFDTHVHADHVTGAGTLRERTGARTHFSEHGGPACADVLLQDGQDVKVGSLVIHGTLMISAPIMVPIMVPAPPLSEAPPMTTAAMTSSSSPAAVVGLPWLCWVMVSRPDKPNKAPAKA